MKRWISQHAYTLRQVLGRLARQPLAHLFNIAVIGIALALPLGLYLVLENLRGMTRGFTGNPQLSVFVAVDAQKPDVTQLGERLRRHAGIARVEFVPKEKALADLRAAAGIADIVESLPANPLPDAWVVTPREQPPEGLEKLRDEIRLMPKVDQVQFDAAWSRRLDAALRLARFLTIVLGSLFAFALVAVTFNTIRLQIVTQRPEIEVSELIGATRPFIRRPFLYHGAIQGLLGGLAAWGIVTAVGLMINRYLVEISRLYTTEIKLAPLGLADGLSLLAFAAAIGWLGAWLSATRNLGARGG